MGHKRSPSDIFQFLPKGICYMNSNLVQSPLSQTNRGLLVLIAQKNDKIIATFSPASAINNFTINVISWQCWSNVSLVLWKNKEMAIPRISLSWHFLRGRLSTIFWPGSPNENNLANWCNYEVNWIPVRLCYGERGASGANSDARSHNGIA